MRLFGKFCVLLARQIVYHFLLFKIGEADIRVLVANFRKKTQATHGPRPSEIMVSVGFSCLKLKRGIDFVVNSVSRS